MTTVSPVAQFLVPFAHATERRTRNPRSSDET